MHCPRDRRAVSHRMLKNNPMRQVLHSSLHKRAAKIREVSTKPEVTEMVSQAALRKDGPGSLNWKTGNSCAFCYTVCFSSDSPENSPTTVQSETV
jgi:hypothetical protein